MYIVYAMHRESPWHDGMSWIGQSYILKTYAKADQLSEILQSAEKDRDITWEIFDTDDAIEVNENDEIVWENNYKVVIKPAKE